MTFALLVNFVFAQSVDTIITWTFPDTAITVYSYEGLESNHGKYQLKANNSDETIDRTISFKNGVTTQVEQATEWDNGADDKGWYIKF